MSVLGFARCENCSDVVRDLVCWPNAAHAVKHVCRPCFAALRATSEWLARVTDSPPEPGVPSLPITPRKRLPIPAGCEWRFLWTLWYAHRGLREPLRNRICVQWEDSKGARPNHA